VARGERSGDLRIHLLSSVDEITALRPVPAIVMIDMPIGLLPSGPRRCEIEARRLLGKPRSSSVFPAPVRPCITAASYEEACAIGMKVHGKKLSRQAWGIVPKIRQVDSFLRAHPEWKGRLREVHPELSFTFWNAGRAMTHGKKTAAGRAERERLVHRTYGRAWEHAAADLPRGAFARDDLFDAFAALWTAERVARGRALVLPGAAQVDKRGLRAEIVV
jgi:predicted RNase H-like nuclease